MLWVLWDIVLPLLATFLTGLLVGWLLWRWRRSRIDAEGLSKLRRTSARYRADVERLQQSNNELSDRLIAVGAHESDGTTTEIDRLVEELESSRREVDDLKSRVAAVDQDIGGVSLNAESVDLRSELAARDRMIATLEKSLQQYGERGDTTALMADIALRDQKIDELEARLATLNRM